MLFTKRVLVKGKNKKQKNKYLNGIVVFWVTRRIRQKKKAEEILKRKKSKINLKRKYSVAKSLSEISLYGLKSLMEQTEGASWNEWNFNTFTNH